VSNLVPDPPDDFERKVQSIVRGLLAVGLVAAYIAFVGFGIAIPTGFDLLTGAAAGFFLGGAATRR
jgi:hypothetical protein